MKWRFLFHEAPSDFLLATEEVLTKSVGRGLAPPTIRVNIFNPTAVLLGRHQIVEEEVNLEAIERYGLDLNRRCSGGGTIIMDKDTPGWEVWIQEDLPGLPKDLEERFEYLSSPILKLFDLIGVKASFRPKNDIEVQGRKISGTALYTDSGGLMFCGTVLLDFNIRRMLEVLKLAPEKISDKMISSFEERITTVKREAGAVPNIEQLIKAFRRAFEETFHIKTEEGDLNDHETELLENMIQRYRNREWIYGKGPSKGVMQTYTKKTPGGLIRIHVKMTRGVIENVLITGDFFAYPPRLVYDLEASLKWVRAEPSEIKTAVIRTFKQVRGEILGITPEELAELIYNATSS